jgi:hypothetical protein
LSGGSLAVRSGDFNASADVNVLTGGKIDVDGGIFASTFAANVSGGGKISVSSGMFDVGQLTVDGPGSRFTLDGGELETGEISLTNGGQLDWESGTLTLPGGTFAAPTAVPFGAVLNTARDEAVTMAGPFFQAVNSTINAHGKTLLGSSSQVNGFVGQGTLNIGSHSVIVRDANDAVLDSAALVTLGSTGSPGELVADNGLTLDFGANVAGFGKVDSPIDAFRPLVNNGHVAGNSAVEPITLSGYVKGVGTLDNVVITGTDAPGFSPATVFRGSVRYDGMLEIELAGAAGGQYDAIHHSGVATLGGTLDVSLISGFAPSIGDTFEIVTASAISGMFDIESLPTLAGGLSLDVTYNTTNVVLAVVGITGDYNLNGVVDAADYTVWRNNAGEVGTGLAADGDRNGTINDADFDIWKSHFGQVAASGSAASSFVTYALPDSSSVPEPGALTIVLVPMLIAYSRRR